MTGVGYGNTFAGIVIGIWAYALLVRRVSGLLAVVGAAMLCLLALAPVQLGESFRLSTIAMSYNRQGYALLGLLILESFPLRQEEPVRGVGGALSTGNYCDYRNPALVSDNGEQGNMTVKITGGLLWQQWLGTALQAMGLGRADYETNGLGGYPGPVKFVGPGMTKIYPDDVWNVAGEPLPFLKP